MDAAQEAREKKKKALLTELSELMIEQQVEEGVFLETPHYSVIERAAARPRRRRLPGVAHDLPGGRKSRQNRGKSAA